MNTLPRDVYIAFWRGSIERYRQSAKLCRDDPARRRYIAICRKRAGQALRAHGATYQDVSISETLIDQEPSPCTS